MGPISQIRWPIFGAIFGIMIFTSLIQTNSTENINQHSNPFQNKQNITIPHVHIDPDFVTSHPQRLSNELIKLRIIQNLIDNFASILLKTNHKDPNRYKRGSISPPSSTNSSKLAMIENVISKLQEQLTSLNASTSLSADDKSRINVLETTVKELQTILDSFQKEYEQTTQATEKKLETAILIGMAQSIKSRQFSFAEEQLQLSDDSMYRKIVQRVYNHRAGNINLLINFGGFIQNLEQKFKLYQALYYEMKTNEHTEISSLLRLSQSLRKGILEVATGTIMDRSRSFVRILWEENRNVTLTLISTAFLNDTWWPMVKDLRDEIQRACGLKFLGDVYNAVVEKVLDTLGIKNILAKVDRNINITEERVMIHEGIINDLQRKDTLYTNNTLWLVRHMKKTWDNPEFNNDDWRYRYKVVVNRLPTSLANIVLSSSICIKNAHFNEYLYGADSEYMIGKYRHIFTWIPKNDQISTEFKWKVTLHDDCEIEFKNLKYNEKLHYCDFQNDKKKFYGCLSNESSVLYDIYFDKFDEGLKLTRSSYPNYHLFVDDNIKRDDYRRYLLISKSEQEPNPYNKWELVDCSDFAEGI